MAWQSVTRNLNEKIAYLLTTKELSDITLIVGENKKSFLSHKLLLSIYSEVFCNMIYGSVLNDKYKIILSDDDSTAVDIFLKHIYVDEITLNSISETISALRFAHKYKVTSLKKICVTYLNNHLCQDYIFEIYEIAKDINEEPLRETCWRFIKDDISEVIKNKKLLTVKFETMLDIVSKDDLKLESELDMYNAVVAWGRKQIEDNDIKKLLEKVSPLIQQVRFISMTYCELLGSPSTDGLLTKNELFEIVRRKSSNAEKLGVNSYNVHQWYNPRMFRSFKLYHFYSICRCHLQCFRNFPTITEIFKTRNHNLCIWGVFLKIGFTRSSYEPSVKLKIDVTLRITNKMTSARCHNTVKITVFVKEKRIGINDIPVFLYRPVIVKKNEICEIILSPLLPLTLSSHTTFVSCRSNCSLSSQLERTNFNENSTHFSAIIVEII
ncbi:BTB/POZ domain-containing protein 6-A-like [Centruroides sculpturatus]|uniref:BTB/POZ domain-containing protein 6-A-like n=1 Tax=Centruroides sculpturatus TaxID=218467 RepID=UPI000C6E9CF0|nr:BTB/POZ domain-containing protein 6-A-like [Centruroides sculpturatus]